MSSTILSVTTESEANLAAVTASSTILSVETVSSLGVPIVNADPTDTTKQLSFCPGASANIISEPFIA